MDSVENPLLITAHYEREPSTLLHHLMVDFTDSHGNAERDPLVRLRPRFAEGGFVASMPSDNGSPEGGRWVGIGVFPSLTAAIAAARWLYNNAALVEATESVNDGGEA